MFYVTQIRDSKYRVIAGPFETKAAAEAEVDQARRNVCAADLWSDFDSFGVMHDLTRTPEIIQKSSW